MLNEYLKSLLLIWSVLNCHHILTYLLSLHCLFSESNEIPRKVHPLKSNWQERNHWLNLRSLSNTVVELDRDRRQNPFKWMYYFIFSPYFLLMHFMFSFSLEKVLEAITTAGEWRAIERFSPIAQGLRDRSVQLQVSAKYMCSHWNLIELVVSLIFFFWNEIWNGCGKLTISTYHKYTVLVSLSHIF